MKIESKFDVGQKVYDLGSQAEMTIKNIVIGVSKEGCDIIYVCLDDEAYTRRRREDELSTEKPKPKSVYELREGDRYYGWYSVCFNRGSNSDKEDQS